MRSRSLLIILFKSGRISHSVLLFDSYCLYMDRMGIVVVVVNIVCLGL